jgi:hypothetical protein
VVDQCTGAALSGVLVTVKTGGGATVATGTTIAGGCVDIVIGSAGTYTVVYALAAYNTRTDTGQSLVCSTIVNRTLQPTSVPAGHDVCTPCGCIAQAPGPTLTYSPLGLSGVMTYLANCRWSISLGGTAFQLNMAIGTGPILIRNGVTNINPSSQSCSPLHLVFVFGGDTYTITP